MKSAPGSPVLSQQVTDCLSVLVEHYPVLVYNGQNDIILGPALTVKSLEQLRWSGQSGWNAVKKTIWSANPADKTDVAGYVRSFSNLTVRERCC